MSAFRVAGLVVGRVIRCFSGPRPAATTSTIHVAVDDLGQELDGYTILALSDLHHSPGRDLAWLRHAVDTATAASPDMIALLGDYGESFKRMPVQSRRWYRDIMREMTPELTRLRARDGVVAVLGNHDYYAGAAAVTEWLTSMGIDVLVNRARRVLRSGSALRVAGLDDVREGRVDAYAGCDVASRYLRSSCRTIRTASCVSTRACASTRRSPVTHTVGRSSSRE